MRKDLRSNLEDYFVIGSLLDWQEQLWAVIRRKASAIYKKPLRGL